MAALRERKKKNRESGRLLFMKTIRLPEWASNLAEILTVYENDLAV